MSGTRGILLVALLGAVATAATVRWRAASDDDAGRRALVVHDCGVCHRIPGIRGARGTVGPSLEGFGKRVYIAGRLPNTEAMLVRWIVDPPALAPNTAMPALGVGESEARAIAAYLHALR